jgi:hypothetical protein
MLVLILDLRPWWFAVFCASILHGRKILNLSKILVDIPCLQVGHCLKNKPQLVMNHWQATKFGNYPNNLLAMTKKLVRLCFDSNPNTTCVLRHTSDTWFYFAKQPDIRFCWSLGFVFYGLSQTRVYAQIVKFSSCPNSKVQFLHNWRQGK